MSICRYFLPKVAKKTTAEGSTNGEDRRQEAFNGHDVIVIPSEDEDDDVCIVDNIQTTVLYAAETKDLIAETAAVIPNPSFSAENPFAQWARPVTMDETRPSRILPRHCDDDAMKRKTNKRKRGNGTKKSSSSFTPMKELSAAEQRQEIEKWHSLVRLFEKKPPFDDDEVEPRRFHLLVATLLHARCQEPCVRQAILRWNAAFDDISVPTVAQCTVEEIQPHFRNLQYHRTKAQYIIAAAQHLLRYCQGVVPTEAAALLALPGVGPLFADLLAFVNAPAVHEQQMQNERMVSTAHTIGEIQKTNST